MVLERETGIRHLLLRVNGMRGGPFWAATITADCICFWACAAVVALIGLLFDRPPFTLVSLPHPSPPFRLSPCRLAPLGPQGPGLLWYQDPPGRLLCAACRV